MKSAYVPRRDMHNRTDTLYFLHGASHWCVFGNITWCRASFSVSLQFDKVQPPCSSDCSAPEVITKAFLACVCVSVHARARVWQQTTTRGHCCSIKPYRTHVCQSKGDNGNHFQAQFSFIWNSGGKNNNIVNIHSSPKQFRSLQLPAPQPVQHMWACIIRCISLVSSDFQISSAIAWRKNCHKGVKRCSSLLLQTRPPQARSQERRRVRRAGEKERERQHYIRSSSVGWWPTHSEASSMESLTFSQSLAQSTNKMAEATEQCKLGGGETINLWK